MEARIRRSNLHLIKASIVKKRAQKRKNSWRDNGSESSTASGRKK
jgi:hypothetical protein